MTDFTTAKTIIFIFITIFLGGGAAWLTGRAMALSWVPLWRTWIWMVPLAAAVRFIHFSLFHNELLELDQYLIDFFILVSASSFGYFITRKRQMQTQYGFKQP